MSAKDWKETAKGVIQVIAAIFVLVFAGGYLWEIWKFGWSGDFDGILKKHFVASVGIPLAALAAGAVVALFNFQSHKDLELNISKLITLKGGSGQVTLWVLCFLSIVLSLQILWPITESKL